VPSADQLRERLVQHVHVLAELIGPRESAHLSALDAARAYIARELHNATGIAPTTDPYDTPIRPAANIEVVLPGLRSDLAQLVIGAHYDTALGTPGADDNASAVGTLIEVARALAAMTARRRTVRIVGFDCEEPPFFGTQQMGSARHAKQLADAGARVFGMVCLESLGYYCPPGSPKPPHDDRLARIDRLYFGGRSIVVVGTPRSLWFAWAFTWRFMTSGLFPIAPMLLMKPNGVAALSDNRNYWAAGFPAVMLTDTAVVRNPYYHTLRDRLATLDVARWTKVTSMAIRTICRLAR
jgi:hypothetical protein